MGKSVQNPSEFYRDNVDGTCVLLDAMCSASVDKLEFSSAAAVCGEPKIDAINETAALIPVNPYGVTKLTCERMTSDFASVYGQTSVCLRHFNAAGANSEGKVGEDLSPESHFIPSELGAVLGIRALFVFSELIT